MVSPSPQKQRRNAGGSSRKKREKERDGNIQLSASGVDLRNWIKSVQEKADQEARSKDADSAIGWADRRKRGERGSGSRRREDLPNLKGDILTTNVFDEAEIRVREAAMVDDEDQDVENRRGRQEKQSKDKNVKERSSKEATKEARQILNAYNKVESVAGETRVKKFGKIGAEETKINHKKASVELAKAHNVAIKISLQRSRRRTLRSYFKNIAMFVIEEEMRLVEFKDKLSLGKDIRMKILLFRSWKEYNKRLNIQTDRLVTKRNMKTLRGVFNVWFEVMKDNMLFLEKHHEMKEWRMLGRCFKNLKVWARDCRRGREEAQKEIEKKKLKAMEEKARRYYRVNLVGVVFLEWSVFAKESCEMRKLAQQQDRRRSRVQALLDRVKDKVEEGEGEEDGGEGSILEAAVLKEDDDLTLGSVDSRRRDEKRAKLEEKRQIELKEQRKCDEIERRREQMKLAKMHNLMTRYSSAFSTWFVLVKELRLKERKADVFNEDITLASYWKRLIKYVEARKDLKRDLEARAMRKADEYAYDVLCWKVFNSWRGNVLKLMAKAKAVRRQAKCKTRERIFKRWRVGLDKERLIWWEANKHAGVRGKRCNLQFFWGLFKERIVEAKEERMEDEKVKKKMMEVRQWLE
ncbi:hypothetical protein TL16_g11173 [Triparma laevis f. inornata]|uniref:Sfi1 spindle body domain-containing protein n=1 Tax=Triparma laevis f. inornata TaxID=1714386 RepID=A0A9W7BDC9_9STRA|nr:hypothetical protein TL16_g11173 [Triparma laevis f. inornata]